MPDSAMPTAPLLVVRSSQTVQFVSGPDWRQVPGPPGDTFAGCRGLQFSGDGTKLAWVTESQVKVAEVSGWQLLLQLQLPHVAAVSFSPTANIFSVWHPLNAKKGGPNLRMYDLRSGEQIAEFTHKTYETWEPQWTADGCVFCRQQGAQAEFFNSDQPAKPARYLTLSGLSLVSLSPGAGTHVLAFIPAHSSQPASARLYKYPKLSNDDVISRKTFFRADSCSVRWNSRGTCCALLVSSEVDKTGQSYYGESSAYCLDSRGNAVLLQPDNKKGPVYAIEFSPAGDQFCMVYGFMPSRAALYNLKFELIHQFEPDHRNSAHYSPHGDLLLLAGSGTVRGRLQVWHVARRQLVAAAGCDDVTEISWCPDGVHISTATCAPRLREANCFRVWDYSLRMVHEQLVPTGQLLYSTCWQPAAAGNFPRPVINSTGSGTGGGSARNIAPAKPAGYVPPCARNRIGSAAIGSSGRARVIPGMPLAPQSANSAAKTKTKQKKEKSAPASTTASTTAATAAAATTTAAAASAATADQLLCANQPSADSAEQQKVASTASADSQHTGLPADAVELKKKRDNIKKKLKDIGRLKKELAEGKQLQPEQLEKLAKEKQLQQDLNKLSI